MMPDLKRSRSPSDAGSPSGHTSKRANRNEVNPEDDTYHEPIDSLAQIPADQPMLDADTPAAADGSLTPTSLAPADSVSVQPSNSSPGAVQATITAPPTDATPTADKDEENEDGTREPPPQNIHMRALIVTQDASIIIGKGGSHVNEIREKSGARITVSESIPGNPERILNVTGPLDAVAKAFGLIVRQINDEPFEQPSVPGSRAVTIKFIIPNSRMGTLIGKAGSKIKEIQEASGAKLHASEGLLPGSTERVLNVSGVADAIHIATYYVGNSLLNSHPSYSSTHASYKQQRRPMASTTYYPPNTPVSNYGYPGPAAAPAPVSLQQTQNFYIPNDLVGSIIGKGGAKINEIRHVSGCQIKILEPGQGPAPGSGAVQPMSETERMVTITGGIANIQMAVQLLASRIEQEKQRLAR
ncbi:hypothetical protein DACRYDRAFT_20011 [Dacryopinax primogenitus]|uniref:K Homology domain-containing protein n=1 Tax=Dacryopinax primogenitus (strain DJM 731) TaxID=1858805 RepID=M5G5N3_DACPD|nr:uncharacterized protein DACRYDRAFT_20011 [Dacryopinax primogenitus]EJU05571.1 hypothetical protein DACRYDRAFT_20011 [Dacryopinax primogenitus]